MLLCHLRILADRLVFFRRLLVLVNALLHLLEAAVHCPANRFRRGFPILLSGIVKAVRRVAVCAGLGFRFRVRLGFGLIIGLRFDLIRINFTLGWFLFFGLRLLGLGVWLFLFRGFGLFGLGVFVLGLGFALDGPFDLGFQRVVKAGARGSSTCS